MTSKWKHGIRATVAREGAVSSMLEKRDFATASQTSVVGVPVLGAMVVMSCDGGVVSLWMVNNCA